MGLQLLWSAWAWRQYQPKHADVHCRGPANTNGLDYGYTNNIAHGVESHENGHGDCRNVYIVVQSRLITAQICTWV
eukprot:84685-Amorphochlora_amoeboformis.AAC.1